MPSEQPPHLCFGCGADNPDGLALRFETDPATGESRATVVLPPRYTGPPGHAHGGIVATLLDEAMSKVNAALSLRCPTAELTVEYLRPVPLGAPLSLTGRCERREGRAVFDAAEIRLEDGTLLARGRGRFVLPRDAHARP